MKYANVNSIKMEAFPKGRGTCYACESELVAKCGKTKINHWAHKSTKMCDHWWESETEWHRTWKSHFPVEWQERIHFDSSGEKHIADIKTPSNVVIEFQNSPISIDELQSREHFYINMIWIVNGIKFKDNIYIGKELPNPNSPEFSDIVINYIGTYNVSGTYYHTSGISQYTGFVEYHNVQDIYEDIIKHHIGHYHFYWQRPKETWLTASKPVFFDLGDDYLWRLVNYYEPPKNRFFRKALRRYLKSDVINRALGISPTHSEEATILQQELVSYTA